jgi:hypothetical protein
MGRWLQLLLGRGRLGDRVIAAEDTVDEMFTPQVALSSLGLRELPITTYGLGWFVQTYRGHLYAWHSGILDGYYALVGVLLHDDLGVVVLTNRSRNQAPEVLSRWIFDRHLGLEDMNWQAALVTRSERMAQARARAIADRIRARRVGTTPSLPLAAYAGRYRHPAYGDIEVRASEHGLSGSFHAMEGPLEHFHDDVYLFLLPRNELAPDLVLSFQIGANGEVESLASSMQKKTTPVVFVPVTAEEAGD